MNMKRIFALALMMLSFLPAWAVADIYVKPADHGVVQRTNGTVEVMINKPGTTIVFDNESDAAGVVIDRSSDAIKSVKLELIGKNSIIGDTAYKYALLSYIPLTIVGKGSLVCKNEQTYGTGLSVVGDLTIQSGKITAEGALFGILVDGLDGKFTFCGDELTVKGSDDLGGVTYTDNNGTLVHSFTLPGAPSVPDGYVFKAWSVNGKEKQPGQVIDTAGSERISIKPVFAQFPQTGDKSGIMLWSALACISLLSVVLLTRKHKEA